jgi:hypothetical protein
VASGATVATPLDFFRARRSRAVVMRAFYTPGARCVNAVTQRDPLAMLPFVPDAALRVLAFLLVLAVAWLL